MLTANHLVTAARAVLAVGTLTAAVLMLGPFQGAEAAFGLNDKAAHVIAFGGLTAVAFLAFPRMRRSDLALAALLLGASVEVAQLFGARGASLGDVLADAAGVGIIHFASQIETLRGLARNRGHLALGLALADDRRRSTRRSSPAGLKTAFVTPDQRPGARPARFASRAAAHFPPREPV